MLFRQNYPRNFRFPGQNYDCLKEFLYDILNIAQIGRKMTSLWHRLYRIRLRFETEDVRRKQTQSRRRILNMFL